MEPFEVAAELAAHFMSAWNRHDMDEFGRLFRDDASFVNLVGVHMRGREEIHQMHAEVHAGPYRDSRLLLEVDEARELTPTVIVAVVRSRLSGDARAPGEIRHSVLTFVVDQREGAWRIAAAQNTVALNAPPGR